MYIEIRHAPHKRVAICCQHANISNREMWLMAHCPGQLSESNNIKQNNFNLIAPKLLKVHSSSCKVPIFTCSMHHTSPWVLMSSPTCLWVQKFLVNVLPTSPWVHTLFGYCIPIGNLFIWGISSFIPHNSLSLHLPTTHSHLRTHHSGFPLTHWPLDALTPGFLPTNSHLGPRCYMGNIPPYLGNHN